MYFFGAKTLKITLAGELRFEKVHPITRTGSYVHKLRLK
jgi:hypothetical protein